MNYAQKYIMKFEILYLDVLNWNLHQFLGLNFVKANNWIVDYGVQHIFKVTLHNNVFGPFGKFTKSNIFPCTSKVSFPFTSSINNTSKLYTSDFVDTWCKVRTYEAICVVVPRVKVETKFPYIINVQSLNMCACIWNICYNIY
jgi:hypothetical protein